MITFIGTCSQIKLKRGDTIMRFGDNVAFHVYGTLRQIEVFVVDDSKQPADAEYMFNVIDIPGTGTYSGPDPGIQNFNLTCGLTLQDELAKCVQSCRLFKTEFVLDKHYMFVKDYDLVEAMKKFVCPQCSEKYAAQFYDYVMNFWSKDPEFADKKRKRSISDVDDEF